MNDLNDELLTAKSVEGMTGVPVGTLAYWRYLRDGTGPRSFKLGRKCVYKKSDVLAWIEQQYAKAGER